MKKLLLPLVLFLSVTLFAQQNCGTVTDYEGNTYGTVKIGQQCWMTENMRAAYYADGVAIPMAIIYNGVNANTDTVFNLATYGRLYNWSAATRGATTEASQGVCPDGWHVPSMQEYQTLANAYSVTSLRSMNYWLRNPGNNASGFDMRPGGLFNGENGRCENLGGEAYFFTSTVQSGTPVHLKASCDCWDLMYTPSISASAFSVRCVKDEESETPATSVDGQPCPGTPTVTDHEGNVYNTVQIGNQCWTKENMRCTTSPSTGTTILEYPANSSSYTGKKAYYVDGNANNTATYGLLYNWCAAVDTFNVQYGETSTNTTGSNAPSVTFAGNRRGVCPQGWHVPSDAEWTQLTNYVSSQDIYCCNNNSVNISKALAGTTGWNSNSTAICAVDNTPADNNATGFSALPASEYWRGDYSTLGDIAGFWAATQDSNTSDFAHFRYLLSGRADVGNSTDVKPTGCSVRCLKD